MTTRRAGVLGLLILAAAWLGPLPGLASRSFISHMAIHLSVVALAAPLLGWWLAQRRQDRAPSRTLFPLFAAAIEAIVIWAWHTPVLHGLASTKTPVFVLEQALYLGVALAIWTSAFRADLGHASRGAGAASLLMASMHMALLGALLAVSPRPLYASCGGAFGLTASQDQHWGGVMMLAIGGSSYLAGGLFLLSRLLQPPRLAQ